MEYISLTNLQNKYPSTLNYETGADKKVRLIGAYTSLNKLTFSEPKIKLDVVEKVDGTSFNFVIGIKEKATDTKPSRYFTSPQYYSKLKLSITQSNPYFINRALDDTYIVTYSVDETIKMLKGLQESEKKDLVTLPLHIYLDSDGKVDYEKLIKYIDWLVTPVSPNDAINGGVLMENKLGGDKLKIEKKILDELPSSANAGTGGSSGGSGGGSPSNSNNSSAFSATVAASIPSSTNTSNGYYNTNTTPATSLPTGTDTSQGGSRNYYYNVRNDSGAVVTVYWKKNNIPTRFQAIYAPGQSGTICAQEGTIDGDITRVQVAGCGS
jgi:biopolymer transport protein ExbD